MTAPKQLVRNLLISSAAILALPAAASAHVIVTPAQAGIGQELVFNVSVPNERNTTVTTIKLDIPSGVSDVTPTMIPGWNIQTAGGGDNVTAITWTGNIPVGQREDFSFGAQVPGHPTELDWKAYQTYADGTVVHWDQKPAGSDDAVGTAGPYSITHVVNDLSTAATSGGASNNTATLALVTSLAALAASVGGLFIRRRRRQRRQ